MLRCAIGLGNGGVEVRFGVHVRNDNRDCTPPEVKLKAICGPNLFVGGAFTRAGGTAVNYVARWDGTNWGDLDGGVTPVWIPYSSPVDALLVQSNVLYVGGSFTTAGGVPATNVARWIGTG